MESDLPSVTALLREIDSAFNSDDVARQEDVTQLVQRQCAAQKIDRELSEFLKGRIEQGRAASLSRRMKAEPKASCSVAVGTILKNRFVMKEVIGTGGMGLVFKALDLFNEEAEDRDPYVAIKVLNDKFRQFPDALKSLQRESRKSKNLAHPNIVTVYDCDRDGDAIFMCMEYLRGSSLAKLIAEHPKGLEASSAIRILRQVANGLSYAHVNGIVHSDLKPGNIFITDSGRAKVIDFGISRAIRQAGDEDVTRFDPGSLNALTPAYASIEMIESGSDPDPRDDIFALGIIFYQMLTGRHPFNGWMATRAFREGLKPQRPATLTSRQWKGLQRALRFERAQRTSSVTQFIDDLRPPKFKFPNLSLGRLSFAKLSLPRFSFKINVYRGASIFALFGLALIGLFYLTQSSPPSFAPVEPPLAANSVVPATPPAPTPPAPQTPAPETKVAVTDTSILGRWCGDEGTLSVTPVAFKTNAGTPKQKAFAIYKIALADGIVTLMAETEDHHIAQTEFGDFSSSLDSMSELRTRVDSESWTEARHRFRRC